MVIATKADTSTGYDGENEPTGMNKTSLKDGFSAPPAYEETITASQDLVNLPPATNHYYINKTYDSLSGIYNIDTSLSLPAFVVGSDETATDDNLHLESNHGSIKAKVALTSTSSEPAKIFLRTKHGAISCRVLSRVANQPVKIHLKTTYGSITVGLPRSFHGPLSHTSRNIIKFSPGLKEQLRLISGGRSFVGDWTNASELTKEWPGDEVTAENSYDTIRFAYIDELEYEDTHGFFSTVKGLLGL